MKKALISVVLLVVLFALCACGACAHEWTDATCTAPKTCAKCGETEGEALGHDATGEADYWSAPVCSRCGEEIGERLEPEFEKLGMDWVAVTDIDAPGIQTPRSGNGFFFGGEIYVTCCADKPSETTYGAIALKDYKIIESDETHEAKEGYEWRIAEFDIAFYDMMAIRYGYGFSGFIKDYYTFDSSSEIGNNNLADGITFSLDYKGKTYADCYEIVYIDEGRWENESIPSEQDATISVAHRTIKYEVLAPVGYDGRMFVFYNYKNCKNPDIGNTALDKIDSDTVFIRLV